jgi:hypothetical protein
MKTIIPSKAIIVDSKKLFEYPIKEKFLRFSLHVLILRISVFSFIVPIVQVMIRGTWLLSIIKITIWSIVICNLEKKINELICNKRSCIFALAFTIKTASSGTFPKTS